MEPVWLESVFLPYTTLFRSLDLAVRTPDGTVAATGRAVLDAGQSVEDRKSTRLNSSHTVISYAVFCLEKKNQPKPRLPEKFANCDDQLTAAVENAVSGDDGP